VLRLRQVALVARSLAPIVEEIRDVLGLEVAFRDPSVASFGLENALFPIGDQFLEVVSPIRQGTAAGRYLDRRGGDGGYMVILQCDDPAERERRAVALGIRKAFEQDTGGYRHHGRGNPITGAREARGAVAGDPRSAARDRFDVETRVLQLHPRDTGGCFLSVDFQEGGEDREGPWHPAGPTWRAAVRSGVVCSMTRRSGSEKTGTGAGKGSALWSSSQSIVRVCWPPRSAAVTASRSTAWRSAVRASTWPPTGALGNRRPAGGRSQPEESCTSRRSGAGGAPFEPAQGRAYEHRVYGILDWQKRRRRLEDQLRLPSFVPLRRSTRDATLVVFLGIVPFYPNAIECHYAEALG
jgi:Glyoxalase-like domain